MNIRDTVDSLMQKPVSRKQFLQHVGILMLIMIGIGPLLHSLSNSHHEPEDGGYGVAPFGH